MATSLIRARPNVFGRQATEEERTRLRDFAQNFVASTPTRSATDAAVLERQIKKLRASGYRLEVSSKKAGTKGAKVRGATASPKNAPKTTSVKRAAK
ncbi:hypothetical protein QF025_006935 [Paraburkholderia graminis]|uniref:Uncharacterized protein n=1 Tax=Paraburkholderia graminis TaxID=60548 RepID=A0ABD5CSL7_9BURK|nr:hypothetical protein [Paraburkholderia graminis]